MPRGILRPFLERPARNWRRLGDGRRERAGARENERACNRPTDTGFIVNAEGDAPPVLGTMAETDAGIAFCLLPGRFGISNVRLESDKQELEE